MVRDLPLISGPGESYKLPESYKPTVNSLQINSKSRDLLLICGPGESHKLPGSYKSTVNPGATNQQQSPGFAVDLWARNLLLICGFLMKSYKPTVNSGATNQQQIPGFAVDFRARRNPQIAWELRINSKFPATNQQQIPKFAVDLWARNLLLICC